MSRTLNLRKLNNDVATKEPSRLSIQCFKFNYSFWKAKLVTAIPIMMK